MFCGLYTIRTLHSSFFSVSHDVVYFKLNIFREPAVGLLPAPTTAVESGVHNKYLNSNF
jgi:hypothetical protein